MGYKKAIYLAIEWRNEVNPLQSSDTNSVGGACSLELKFHNIL
jgi:hypothetical protein